ncbi:NAD(P)-dependent oxidoreductase [Demequina maris]|uniref:NAD(P)-dependent oxidoreductase n=1 Tax=Demequina maris TaxID=1638982 RepID=UPI000785CCA6|nr:NAD(P)H-binding protein [Demequina maris]
MNVTVFGATGAIGSLIVAALLDRGDHVTAYVRNPAKVPASWADRVRVVVGEMNDAARIDDAVAGSDAVISALGPSMDRHAVGLPLVGGTAHTVAAMHAHGVARFIGHGTPSIVDTRDKPTAQSRLTGLMGRMLLPRAYQELLGMSRHIMDSDLEWTIIRFTAPKDGPAKGINRAGFYGTDRIGFAVTRADIAAFTVAQLTDTTYLRAAPAISN